MSINSCTINSTTIDSICSSRRSVLIQNLLGTVVLVTSLYNFGTEVDQGLTVTGELEFTNNGPGIAVQNNFTLTLPIGLASTPILSNLPVGASYSYNAVTGQVIFIGMPSSLQAGQSLGPIGISFIQLAGGSVVMASVSSFTTSTGQSSSTVTIPANDVVPHSTTPGHHPQHVNPSTRDNFNIFRRDSEEEDTVDTSTLELPSIAITIIMAGQEFTQTLERGDVHFAPMINVYNLAIKAGTVEESVNISDISFRII